MNRKIKFQKGGSVLSSQEALAERIASGQRPKRRSAAERRGGRTTSNPFTEEQRDTASKVFLDPRPFEKAYDDFTSGKELSSENKTDLGVETGFAALGAVPVFGTAAQRGNYLDYNSVMIFLMNKSGINVTEKGIPSNKPPPPHANPFNLSNGLGGKKSKIIKTTRKKNNKLKTKRRNTKRRNTKKKIKKKIKKINKSVKRKNKNQKKKNTRKK